MEIFVVGGSRRCATSANRPPKRSLESVDLRDGLWHSKPDFVRMFYLTLISTLRFLARPAAVLLSAIGLVSPNP